MKHKHYDMIVAKAENMDLVVFVKSEETENGGLLVGSVTHTEWSETGERGDQMPCFHSDLDYFLCLPQHKEACLHWLNGGDVQDFFEEEWSDCASLAHATEVGGDNTLEFSMYHMFMNEEFNFRIAPKKEKRVVVYDEAANKFEETAFKNIDEAKEEIGYSDAQFIEIEIEVTG